MPIQARCRAIGRLLEKELPGMVKEIQNPLISEPGHGSFTGCTFTLSNQRARKHPKFGLNWSTLQYPEDDGFTSGEERMNTILIRLPILDEDYELYTRELNKTRCRATYVKGSTEYGGEDPPSEVDTEDIIIPHLLCPADDLLAVTKLLGRLISA